MAGHSGPDGQEPSAPVAPGAVFDDTIVTDLQGMLSPSDFDGILRRAEATLAKLADELGQVSADPDGTRPQRSAHMLAGLAGNFGCAAVMTTARAIEAAYRAGDGQHAAQMLGELKRLMPPTLDALRRARLKPPP